MDTIEFGRQLVRELKLGGAADTASRWMAHFLADRITAAASATGHKKEQIESQCFDLVLKIWRHRASMPELARPLRSFEKIAATLETLFTRRTTLYFDTKSRTRISAGADWLDLARSVDRAAVDIIEWCIAMATSAALKKDRKWVESAIAAEMDNGPDLQVARMLTEHTAVLAGTNEELEKIRIKRLEEVRIHLSDLVSLSAKMGVRIKRAMKSSKSKKKTKR